MTSPIFQTFLKVILPKTLKVFYNQYHGRNKTIDAKLKHGSVTEFSRCHGNTHYPSFHVIWILGVFPVKFQKKKPANLIRFDWIFPCKSPHVCLWVQERLYLQSHDLFITDSSQNNNDNVVKTSACCPGVSLCVKIFYLLL